jgi:Tfp pilus assembly protein PilO
MSLTTPMKIVIAIFIIILIGAGFYLLDYQAKFTRLDQAETDLRKSQADLEAIKTEIKGLGDLNKQLEAKQRELREVVVSKMSAEDPQLFVPNYIAEIERMVVGQQEATGDYDFDIQSISPGAASSVSAPGGDKGPGGPDTGAAQTPDALSGFPTRVFQMSMTSKYSTLVDFLYQLGALKLDRLVTINKISLSPNKADGAESPVLSVQLPITAYMRVKN